MQELLNSMVKLSAAMTVFSMQQMQTAVGNINTKESVDKLREVIDAMAAAVSSKIDESRRPAVDSFTRLPREMMDKTIDSTRDAVYNTTDMAKKTSDWMAGMMKTATVPHMSEPRPAEEVLIVVAS